ncbi:MAG TPA: NAD(P)-binding domain-containing protein [Candidatus Krumholzibacteria bacterium]|nr:NAD(P)-binding domain-containing protein [Candidatus Krumholzibacteria bacterium]
MKVGILGSGDVGQTLAAGFFKYNHDAMIGTRTPAKLADFTQAHPGVKVGSFADAAKFGDVLVLAVKGDVAADVLTMAGPANLSGKTVLDATNPIARKPPTDNVIHAFTGADESLMMRLQRQFTDVHFVKAFSCVGSASMVDPKFKGGKPSMFIAGNNAGAKKLATTICEQFGFEVEDMGTAEAARVIEPLAILWCIPGFRSDEWTHAFKLLH